MFNLLRRRVKRKQNNKNKYNIDVAVQSSNDNVPKYSAAADADESGEYYRQILEKTDDEQTTAVAIANAGASITGKTSKTTRNGKKEEEEAENLHVNYGKTTKENSAINAGKIYFQNARDKRRHLKKVKNDAKQQQDKQVHLPHTTDNFSNISTYKLKVDDHVDHHYQQPYVEVETAKIAKNAHEQEQQEATSSSRQTVEDVSYYRSACGFSHNELAERQRCVLTTGEYDEILLNRTTTTIKADQLNNIEVFNANGENNRNLKKLNVENVHNINSNQFNNPTRTTNVQRSTINNEVKYRNSDKTSRNEAKRQSRLSFTLAGISFGRKKEVDDRAKNDHYSESDSDSDNDYNNLTKVSIERVTAEPAVKINESSGKKIKLNPFQKSREYLNNLFMARGRQHNRHQRHQQQQQQQQQQQVSKQIAKNDTLISNGNSRVGVVKVVGKTHTNTMTSSSKNANDSAVNVALHLNVTDSTNSYQIPLSNYSTINTKQKAYTAHKNREHLLSRSNSATHAARTHSLSPQLSTKRSRSVTFSDVEHIIEDDRDFWLNRKNFEKFSRTGNIERGGSNLANNTANDKFAQASNNNNTNNTHGVVAAERVEFPTTSAFEHTNNHLIQPTSSHFTNENKKNKQEIDKDKGESKDLLYNKLNPIDNNKSNASQRSSTPTPTPIYRMGQTNAKAETPTREFRESSVSSTTSERERDRVKKVSFANIPEAASSPININLPTITVADYSEALSSATNTPSDQEVYYDFDNSDKQKQQQQQQYNDRENNRMTFDNDIEHDANFYIGATNDHQYTSNNNKWQMPNNVFLSQSQMRHNYVKLEDVREEDENVEEEDAESEEEQESEYDDKQKRPRHLDNELYNSAERSPLKSSDTTLSGSPSDSGIGTDSQPATPSNLKSRHSPTSFYANTKTTTTKNETADIQQLKQQIKQQYGFMSFVRDGNSTDCDEIPLSCDDIDLDLVDDDTSNERLVCIESISLPDVVVESTAATSSSTTLSSTSSTTSSEHIINITSGASGNRER